MERGRDLDGVIKQYNQFVKPMFDFYIQPSMVHADIIVPRGGENKVAINLIVQHVHTQLQTKGFKFRFVQPAHVAPVPAPITHIRFLFLQIKASQNLQQPATAQLAQDTARYNADKGNAHVYS